MAKTQWSAIVAAIRANLQAIDPTLNAVGYYSDSIALGAGGYLEVGPVSGPNEVNFVLAAQYETALYHLRVTVYVVATEEQASQAQMLEFMSWDNPKSVWDALSALGALAGIARKILPQSSHSFGRVKQDGGYLVMNKWDVDVWA